MAPRYDTVTIVGVGLLGGSIGLGLRSRQLARHVMGIGHDPSQLQGALDRGAISHIATSLEDTVGKSDLTVVCLPVGDIASWVIRAAPCCPPAGSITDVGSTKAAIVRSIDAQLPAPSPFVGAHPLAGSHRHGVAAADGNLFQDTRTVLTPTESSNPQSVAAIQEFWQSLGSQVVTMSPEQHDDIVARTSHLPHIVAAVLAASTPTELLSLAGAGWRDTTRIASGALDIWVDILRANREPVLESLTNFQETMNQFHAALTAADWHRVESLLRQGKHVRDTLGN